MQVQHAVEGLHAHRVAVGQALVAHIAHKAARPVAAVLDLTAVAVVDGVGKVNAAAARRGGPHTQNLVGAPAKVAVGQETVLRRTQVQKTPGLVKHHKIVAGALHFGETDVHQGIIQGQLGLAYHVRFTEHLSL